MFGLSSGSAIIDFCIGMSFYFLTLTLVCTMINEYLMDRIGKLRQQTLLEGISGLFYDVQGLNVFYKHPLITGLYNDDPRKSWFKIIRTYLAKLLFYIPATIFNPLRYFLRGYQDELSKKIQPPQEGDLPQEISVMDCVNHFKKLKIMEKLPSYIPSGTFANALLDIVVQEAKAMNPPKDCTELRKMVDRFPNERIKKTLLPLIDSAQNDLDQVRKNIEKWYDGTMDRVSGWFKRRARTWLMLVAFPVCLFLNADAIMVGKMLWKDKELRAVVVKQAESIIIEQPKSGPDLPPAATPNPPPTSPKAKQQQGPIPEKDIKNPAAPAPRDPANQSTGTEGADGIGQRVQKEIDKLQFPLGWVCPEKDKFDKMKCKSLKFILGYFCKYPPPEKQETSVDPGKTVTKEVSTGQETAKDQGDKDQQNKKDKTYEPRTVPTESGDIYLKIMGLFFTTLAISFGAPFWTDLLNSFVNMRRGGNPPPKEGEAKK
jgi:hypothetical protein